jgi:hypothetical protein
MKAALKQSPGDMVPVSKVYDPNNRHPQDLADREFDDTSDGIDWDDIIATTHDDFLAGRFAFNSADYPTHEAAMVALERLFKGILEDVLRETPIISTPDAARDG